MAMMIQVPIIPIVMIIGLIAAVIWNRGRNDRNK